MTHFFHLTQNWVTTPKWRFIESYMTHLLQNMTFLVAQYKITFYVWTFDIINVLNLFLNKNTKASENNIATLWMTSLCLYSASLHVCLYRALFIYELIRNHIGYPIWPLIHYPVSYLSYKYLTSVYGLIDDDEKVAGSFKMWWIENTWPIPSNVSRISTVCTNGLHMDLELCTGGGRCENWPTRELVPLKKSLISEGQTVLTSKLPAKI